MTSRQKLEIGAGVLTSLAVLVDFSLLVVFIANQESQRSEANSFAIVLLLVWICSLIAAIGAYYHVTKQSNIAQATLVTGAVIVMVVLGFCGVFISMFNILAGLIFFAPPVVLSAITLILAMSSRIKAESIKTRPAFEATNR